MTKIKWYGNILIGHFLSKSYKPIYNKKSFAEAILISFKLFYNSKVKLCLFIANSLAFINKPIYSLL